jgi:hypothetical protein
MAEDTDKLIEVFTESMKGFKGSIEALTAATLKNINESVESRKRKTITEVQLEKAANIRKALTEIDEALKSGAVDLKGANQQRKEEYRKFKESSFGTAAEDLSKEFKKLAPQIGDFGLKFGETTADMRKGVENFAKTTGNLTKDIFSAASGATPLSAALSIAKLEASAFGGLLQQSGGYLTTLGAGIVAGAGASVGGAAATRKFTGSLIAGTGVLASLFGKGLGVAKDVLEAVGTTAIAFESNFTKASAAGATFAGGMTELRDAAGLAGVKVGDLVSGISESQEAFARGGANFQSATKIVKGLGTSLSEGKVAVELYSLGFTDNASRIALAGDAFGRARMSGLTLSQSLKDLDLTTLQYGRDLKALQGIVGKDAKVQLDKAQAERMRGALEDKMNAEQANVFDAFFSSAEKTFGAAEGARLQIALSQAAAGDTITDTGILSNQAMMQFIETFKSQLQTGAASVQAAIPGYIETVKKLGTDLKGPMGNMGRTAESASLQLKNIKSDPLIDGIASMYNAAKKGAVSITDLLTPAKDGEPAKDPMVKAFAETTINANKAQVALEQVALSETGIKIFTSALDAASQSVYTLINAIKSAAGSNAVSNVVSGVPSASSMLADAAVLAATVGASMMIGGKPPTPPAPPSSPWSLPREPVPPGGGAGGAMGYISEKAGAALETMKSWFSSLEKVIPESLSSKLTEGLNTVKGFFSKLMTEVGESTIGKAISSGAEQVAAGFGKVTEMFKSAGNTAGNILSKVGGAAKVLPLTGDLYEAYSNYQNSGSLGEATAAGLGSLSGRAGAMAVLTPTTGIGGVLAQGAGGIAGAQLGAGVYRSIFGKSEKPKEEKAVTTQPNTAVGTPAPTVPVAEQLKQAKTSEEQQAIIKRAEKEALDNITKLGLQIDKLNSENLKKPSLEIEKALAESKEYLDKEKAKFQSLMIAKTTIANKEAIKPPVPEVPMDEKAKRYAETLKAYKERWNPSDNPQIKPVENMVGSGRGSVVEKPGERAAAQATPAPATEPSMFDKFKSLFTSAPKPATVTKTGVETQAEKENFIKGVIEGRNLIGVVNNKGRVDDTNAPIDSKTQALVDKIGEEIFIKRTGILSTPQTVTPTPQTGDIKNANPVIDLTSKVTENTLQQQQLNEESKNRTVIAPAVTDNSSTQVLQSLAQELGKMTYAFEEMIDYMRSIATNTKNTFHAVQ